MDVVNLVCVEFNSYNITLLSSDSKMISMDMDILKDIIKDISKSLVLLELKVIYGCLIFI